MAFETKTYELITPKSETDSAYEDHEYLLCWYGRNGAFYQYLFTDWVYSIGVDAEVINERDQDEIRSIILGEERNIDIAVEDLSRNDFEIMASILVAEKIIRLKKDGTIENVAINSNSYSYRQSGGRYNLEFSIRLWNLK